MVGAQPSVPARHVATDEGSLRQWLTEIQGWVTAVGAALFDLDEATTGASDRKLRDELALAFMIFSPVSDRIAKFSDQRLDKASGRQAIVEACWQPVVAATGETVANDLGGALTMLHTMVVRLTTGRAEHEQATIAAAEGWVTVLADVAVAERLAGELGDQIRRAADLSARLSAAPRTAPPPPAMVVEAAALRADLEGVVRRRDELLAVAARAASDRAELAATEREVDELAARCRERIVQAPRLAVPTVERLVVPGDPADRPWGSVRAELEEWERTTDRLRRAFAEARRRFAAPLSEREELRGLVQAYRDKAAASRLVEDPALDQMYAEARDVLWAAPCDLDTGRTLVDRYVAAVNTTIAGQRGT